MSLAKVKIRCSVVVATSDVNANSVTPKIEAQNVLKGVRGILRCTAIAPPVR